MRQELESKKAAPKRRGRTRKADAVLPLEPAASQVDLPPALEHIAPTPNAACSFAAGSQGVVPVCSSVSDAPLGAVPFESMYPGLVGVDGGHRTGLLERLRSAECAIETDLHPVDQHVLGLYARGLSLTGICVRLKRAAHEVKDLIEGPRGQAYLRQLGAIAEMKDRIELDHWEGLRHRAGDVLGHILNGEKVSAKDKLTAVKEVLDREPGRQFSRMTRVDGEVEMRHSVYTPEERAERVKAFVAAARGCTVEELEAEAKSRLTPVVERLEAPVPPASADVLEFEELV